MAWRSYGFSVFSPERTRRFVPGSSRLSAVGSGTSFTQIAIFTFADPPGRYVGRRFYGRSADPSRRSEAADGAAGRFGDRRHTPRAANPAACVRDSPARRAACHDSLGAPTVAASHGMSVCSGSGAAARCRDSAARAARPLPVRSVHAVSR